MTESDSLNLKALGNDEQRLNVTKISDKDNVSEFTSNMCNFFSNILQIYKLFTSLTNM